MSLQTRLKALKGASTRRTPSRLSLAAAEANGLSLKHLAPEMKAGKAEARCASSAKQLEMRLFDTLGAT